MAENEFEAKHIAALDFDVSKIYKQFADLNKTVQSEGKTAADTFKKAFANAKPEVLFDDKTIVGAEKAVEKLKEIISLQGNLSKLTTHGMGETMSAIAEISDNQGRLLAQTYKQIDGEWQKVDERTVDNIKQREEANARQIAQEKLKSEIAARNLEKQKLMYRQMFDSIENGYNKQVGQISKLITQQERFTAIQSVAVNSDSGVVAQSRALEQQLATLKQQVMQKHFMSESDKTQLANLMMQIEALKTRSIYAQNEAKTEAQRTKELQRQLDFLDKSISKGEQFSNRMSKSEASNASVLKSQSDAYVEQLKVVREKVATNQKLNEIEQEILKTAGKYTSELNSQVGKASFLSQMIDKVRWTAAFRITNTLFQIPGQIYEVIKDTEYAVVEITRILNEAQLDTHKYTQDIYNIAIAYGATFEDAVSITKRFAQAGYDSAESLGLMKQALVALNTAELDANQATSGMIAIMKQLGWSEEYALNNLDLLIDKVNITADNFAVDSATIIEALQKVAGTARASGQDLDDMIGIITVLSEATGASGANIGNAYKSIISYIQRASSLNTFENLGIDVYADRAKGTLLPINKILDNLASSWQKWDETARTSFVGANSELVDTLNELNDASGEYQTTLESLNDTAEIGSTIEERNAAQAAAGMHRRNYFIALMNNYNRVQEVTNGLTNAEGYSMAENAKTMDTLEKKVTALKTSIKALLYEAGRAGTLEIAKGITDILTGVVRLTQDIGGLNTVLLAVLGTVTLIKAQAIGTAIATLATRIVKLAGSIKAFIQLAVEAKSVSAALSTTFVGGKAAASGLAGAVSGLGAALIGLTAVIAIANAIDAKRQQQISDNIAKSKEYIEATNNTKKSIQELAEQYKELYAASGGTFDTTQLNAVKNIQDQINGLLGDQAQAVDFVNAKLGEQEQIYKNISLEAAKAARQGLSQAVIESSKALEKTMFSVWSGNQQERLKAGLYVGAYGNQSKEETKIASNLIRYLDDRGEINYASEIYKLYTRLIIAQNELYDSFGDNATEAARQSSLYGVLQARISDLSSAAEAYAATMQAQANDEAYIKYQAKIAKGFEDTKGAVLTFYDEIEDRRSGYTEFEIKAMQKLLEETYPEYFTVVKDGYSEIVDTQSKFNELVAETEASLSELTGAYQTIVGAIEEYNQNGTMSLETLDRLLSLSPQYIALLSDENGELELNAEAYENKLQSMLAVLQAQKLDEITAWVNGLTAEQLAVEGLDSAYKSLNETMLDGKLAALGNALTDKISASILTVEQASSLAEAIKNYFSMFDSFSLSAGVSAQSGNALTNAERQIDWLKFYAKDSASEQLKVYEDLLEKQTALDEDRLATIRKIAQLKIQIAEDEADAAIAAKKREWQELDRADEIRNKRKKLQDELEYWSVRGTSEAQRKRSEITQQIRELDTDIQKESARNAELEALQAKRDLQINEILEKYGEIEQDIISNMLTAEEREKIDGGMENINKIGNLVDKILAKLNEQKPPPNITVNVDGSDAQSSLDLANDISKQIKRELQGYYTK